MTYLNREGEVKVAQAVDEEWKRRVLKVHSNNKREKPRDSRGNTNKKAVYRLYGTTLLGLLITPDFLFAFQLDELSLSSTVKQKEPSTFSAINLRLEKLKS